MDPMRRRSLGEIFKIVSATFATVQSATITILLIIDRLRKRKRRDGGFPSLSPTEIQADDNKVTVYMKGKDLYADMLASIEAAQDSILMETYIWKADRVGVQFKNALIAAADRGVSVYVVYDVFGNLVVPPKFFDFPPNVHVLPHKPWAGMRGHLSIRVPGLNHRKLLVVDSSVAYLGGYNIGAMYASRWRDTHVRIAGDAVVELENVFIDYWNSARGRNLPHLPDPDYRVWGASFSIVRNVPAVAVYPIRYMYMEAFDRASDRIWLTHAYLIPDDDMTRALVEAVERGVDVRIIVPAESNHIVADWLSRGFYRFLLTRGVRLFLYQGAMVHAKTATVDGLWSTIGTANLDRLSLLGNFELNVEFLNEAVAEEMEQIFEFDSENCVELTQEEWDARSWAAKLSEAILSPLRPLL